MTKVEAVKIIMTIIVPLTNDPQERLFWYGLGVSIVTAWPPVPGECRQVWAHEINEADRNRSRVYRRAAQGCAGEKRGRLTDMRDKDRLVESARRRRREAREREYERRTQGSGCISLMLGIVLVILLIILVLVGAALLLRLMTGQ